VKLELARQQWSDGNRRVEASRGEPAQYARLRDQVDVVTQELRRRLGQTYTLDELATAYDRADDWALLALHDSLPDGSPPPDSALVADAAFHAYARGAADYVP
jgi:hypothetical protein